MKKPFIGGHVSVQGGLYMAIEHAEEIGAEAIQFFGASPRMWHTRPVSEKDASQYRKRKEMSKVQADYLHAAYLVNLASPDTDMRKKSIKNLIAHFAIAEALGADGLIFHVGSGKEMPKEDAIKIAIDAMKDILEEVPGRSKLVIENAAGGGQKLGANPQDIGRMLHAVKSKRVGVCFDTAHAFEAGLIDAYTPVKTTALFDEWDKEVGMEHIVALHVNDSKTASNSHHDRHENIGEGYIGLTGFKTLAKEKRLWDKAWLLEVPGFTGEGPDKKNIDILRSCFV